MFFIVEYTTDVWDKRVLRVGRRTPRSPGTRGLLPSVGWATSRPNYIRVPGRRRNLATKTDEHRNPSAYHSCVHTTMPIVQGQAAWARRMHESCLRAQSRLYSQCSENSRRGHGAPPLPQPPTPHHDRTTAATNAARPPPSQPPTFSTTMAATCFLKRPRTLTWVLRRIHLPNKRFLLCCRTPTCGQRRSYKGPLHLHVQST